MENGTVGLSPPEPLLEGGSSLKYFLLGKDDLALKLWLIKPYIRRQLSYNERITNYRISRGMRVLEKAFVILVSGFMVLRSTVEQRPKIVRDILLTYVVILNILRTYHGRRAQSPNWMTWQP